MWWPEPPPIDEADSLPMREPPSFKLESQVFFDAGPGSLTLTFLERGRTIWPISNGMGSTADIH